MKLYELPQSLQVLADAVDAADEAGAALDDEMVRGILDGIENDAKVKVEGIIRLLKNWQAEADAIEAEEKRLRARRIAIEHHAEGLKQYVLECMTRAQDTKWELGLFTAYVGKSTSVVVADVDALPEQYRKTEVVVTAKRRELLEALKKGEAIEGAGLVDTPYLRVR